jgi:hypothetical protein
LCAASGANSSCSWRRSRSIRTGPTETAARPLLRRLLFTAGTWLKDWRTRYFRLIGNKLYFSKDTLPPPIPPLALAQALIFIVLLAIFLTVFQGAREAIAKFGLGFLTAALNPKVALFYMAVLPPFIDPARGAPFLQATILGTIQIAVCTAFDALLVWGAAGTARFLGNHPAWLAAQRWVLGGALGLLAVKLATTRPA